LELAKANLFCGAAGLRRIELLHQGGKQWFARSAALVVEI
jgi:hypothetical protein